MQAEKLYAKSKQDFLLWLTWLPGTGVLIHIHCGQELTDRKKSQYAEHQFAWTRLELFASQLPLFLCLNVIWELVKFRKRHRFEASVVFLFLPFLIPTCEDALWVLHLLCRDWASEPVSAERSFQILPVCLKHLGSETTCAGTILLYTLPEWTVKMFLTHTAMEETLCSTSWKFS